LTLLNIFLKFLNNLFAYFYDTPSYSFFLVNRISIDYYNPIILFLRY